MRRLALALALCGGCHRLLDLEPLKPAGDAAADATPLCEVLPTDDFDDNLLAAEWVLYDPASTVVVAETGQQLVLTLPTKTMLKTLGLETAYNGVVAKTKLDLSNTRIVVEIANVTNLAGFTETDFMIETGAGERYAFNVGTQGSFIFSGQTLEGEMPKQINFVFPEHRFWALRYDAALGVVFETSAEGEVWRSQHAVMPRASLVNSKLNLYAGTYQGGRDDPGAARFERVIVTTACTP